LYNNNKIKDIKKLIQYQRRITLGIKLNKPKLNDTRKLRKMPTLSNIFNIDKNFSLNKFTNNSTTNKKFNKSNSFNSTLTKANTNINTSDQNEINNAHEKINNQFDTSIRRTKKHNLYINPSFIFNDVKNVKYNKNYFNKYKRSKSNNDILIRHMTEKIKDSKKSIIFRNNIFKKSKSKKSLNYYNSHTNTVDMLLNRYPNIEKHRKKKFNQEINFVLSDIKKELNEHYNKLMFCNNYKNVMTPFKININKRFSSKPYLDDENIYKYNIMASSKVLNIKDIQLKNINNFFRTEKCGMYRRSASLENLRLVANKSPKYISDLYCNERILKPGLKINNYHSVKLHEIYETLN
jgi:sulfur relay (sulfurtransferase) DsrC/TusE family protein